MHEPGAPAWRRRRQCPATALRGAKKGVKFSSTVVSPCQSEHRSTQDALGTKHHGSIRLQHVIIVKASAVFSTALRAIPGCLCFCGITAASVRETCTTAHNPLLSLQQRAGYNKGTSHYSYGTCWQSLCFDLKLMVTCRHTAFAVFQGHTSISTFQQSCLRRIVAFYLSGPASEDRRWIHFWRCHFGKLILLVQEVSSKPASGWMVDHEDGPVALHNRQCRSTTFA